ncbi:hypothetical protein [Acinetobacter soli]|jgi:hypothetical protein|uniref:hypothetical protein n=1 Tax=Acinetobacter soli TaxID=487316 RepID=UPI0026DED3AB|nr:hypothetical protein [Acinetobacter soli]
MGIHSKLINKIVITGMILIFLVFILFYVLQCFEEKNISLIKDLLGIGSTIFASLIAVYIFQEWTVQKKIESLSERSKEIIPKFPEIPSELINFSSKVDDLLNRTQIYELNPRIENLTEMERLSTELYKHPFLSVLINFNQSFDEIRGLMLETDLIVFNKLSDDIKKYKNFIFKEKILDVKVSKDVNTEEQRTTIKKLTSETYEDLGKFYEKLKTYKNYNY